MAEGRRAEWYVQLNGVEEGPLTSQTLRCLAEAGRIHPDTPIRKEGMMNPVPASRVKGLLTHSIPSARITSALAYQKEVGPKVTPEPSKERVKRSRWSWKSLCIAVALSFIISVIGAVATGGKIHRNMYWTVMWLYLTIEAWRYWKWKALLPYLVFIVASIGFGVIMTLDSPPDVSSEYVIIKIGLNIGGLIAFYVAVNKAQRKIEESTEVSESYQ